MSENNAENVPYSEIEDNAEETLEYSVLTQNRFSGVEGTGESSQHGGQGQCSVVNNKHKMQKESVYRQVTVYRVMSLVNTRMTKSLIIYLNA